VSEASILDRDLRLGGSRGILRVERAGRSALRARIEIQGTRLSRPSEACTVTLDEPAPLEAEGRAEGLARYALRTPACPLVADLVDGALWVREGTCGSEAQDCRADAAGLWGPDPSALAAQAGRIDQDRGRADRAVRETYKALAQRAQPQDARAIVAEQAAFSSEREMACRSYAREASHGFCNARFTEARAASLAARLGAAPAERPAPGPPRERAERTERRPTPIMPPPASLLPGPR
jgi:hypothetical protein